MAICQVRNNNELFGWQVQKWDGPTEYWLLATGDSPDDVSGGIGKRPDPNEGTTNTIEVPSVYESVEAIKKHGGKVTYPKHAVQGVGWLAYYEDPDGNTFGVIELDPEAKLPPRNLNITFS
ncbi:MAG: VOC family protein [Anaerolineae bacterium]|nr:VOC family protein [Anaerolineae bacterium]